jgi:hypothetical protein
MAAVVRRVLVLMAGLGCAGLWGAGLTRIGSAQSAAAPTQVVGQEPLGAKTPDVKVEETKPESVERPLPDIPSLMRAVEANEKTAEAVEKDYLYHAFATEQASDGHGGVKKTETREYDVFWLEGVEVSRLTKKDGKELSADEQKKESDRIDKEVAKEKEKRAKADEKGKETDPRGHDVVTVSRLLELGSFTNARREQLNGRDVIAVDFSGDPKAKTKNRSEDVIRDMVGTAWMDEQDKVLVKAQGHFVNDFKIGGGLVANIRKGTSFQMEQRKINDEVWLPATIEAQGGFRALLFVSFNGSFKVVNSDYRKFKATSTILPGVSTVQPQPDPQ